MGERLSRLLQAMEMDVAEQQGDERSPGHAGFLFGAVAACRLEVLQQRAGNGLGLSEISLPVSLLSGVVPLLDIPIHDALMLLDQLYCVFVPMDTPVAAQIAAACWGSRRRCSGQVLQLATAEGGGSLGLQPVAQQASPQV